MSVNLDEIEATLLEMKTTILGYRDIALTDFGVNEDGDELDGADDFCDAIYNMQDDVQEALDAIDNIKDQAED